MKSMTGIIIGTITVAACAVAVGALLGGWLLMLTVGVIHGEWLPMMPTIGYWSAVKVSAMLSIAAGIVIGSTRGTD